MKRRLLSLFLLILIVCLSLFGCQAPENGAGDGNTNVPTQKEEVLTFASIEGIPDYSGSPYVELNNNEPEFSEEEKSSRECYEYYAPLDSLGRCVVTHACIGEELMPTEDRESISEVEPSGWINKKYDTDLVDGGWLYNRCHLIGFQLTGENANENNLITGTRYMNVDGMLPFENMVADYLKESIANGEDNHVMYRVTPMFAGRNLVASGVQMEAYSIEDHGESICFNVFVYNVQPGIMINYLTGESCLNEDADSMDNNGNSAQPTTPQESNGYVLNTNSKRFHLPTCSSVDSIAAANKQEYQGSRQSLLDLGYQPCGSCKP